MIDKWIQLTPPYSLGSLTNRKSDIPNQSPESRIDELMDEPCANPRYGGMTIREAVLRLRKHPKPKPVDRDRNLQNSV